MKQSSILFLEDNNYLEKLGIFKSIKKFNGINNYKLSKKSIKDYSLIVSMLYNSPVSNFMILKAKINKIPTLLISDGILEWENMFSNPLITVHNLALFHPVLHDMFLCVGQDETQYFNFLGYKSMQYLPDRMAPTIPRIGKVGTNLFLITTANTAYYDTIEKENLVQLLKDIILTLDSLSFKYIYRIFDDSLVKLLDIQKEQNIKDRSYEECLKLVDYVITTPSSISFTTMYHGKPLAHLIYRDSPMFIQGGWNISGSINIESTLKDMTTYNQYRMNFQEFQVAKYLVDNETVEKEVIEKLEEQKTENIEKFINQNLYNMLNSSFNFNIEYFVRKVYLRFKSFKIMQILKGKVK